MSRRFVIWIFVSTACAVAIALYAGALTGSCRLNDNIRIATGGIDTDAISVSMDYNTITDTNGVTYTIDLGSPHSFMADSTLARLRTNGALPDSIPTFIYTTCPDETARLFNTKHRHALPFASAAPDSENETVAILNAEFLSYAGCPENVIGVDILDRFVVEYLADNHELRLLTSVPGDYSVFIRMSICGISAANDFTRADRYYINLGVNNNGHKSFRIDTGREMAFMSILLPADEAALDEQRGTIQPHECWVDIADRAGFSYANYIDIPTVEPYAINPFVFFEQDFVIDFPAKHIYLRSSTSDYTHAPASVSN